MAARMLRLPLRAAMWARPVVRPLARPVVLRAPALGMLGVRGAGRPFSDAAAWASSADGSAAQAELLAKYKPAIESMSEESLAETIAQSVSSVGGAEEEETWLNLSPAAAAPKSETTGALGKAGPGNVAVGALGELFKMRAEAALLKKLKKEKEAEEAANAQTAPGGAPLPPKAETTGAMPSGNLDQR